MLNSLLQNIPILEAGRISKNPMGPIYPPHAFELEPVIAANIGLVDECLRLHFCLQKKLTVGGFCLQKKLTGGGAMEKQVTFQRGQP